MSERSWKIWLGFCVFLAICWLTQDRYFRHLEIARNDRASLEQRIKDYLDCQGVECDDLYPDAAVVVKKARAEAAEDKSSK